MRRPSLATFALVLASNALACAKPPSSTCAPLGEFPGPEDFDLVTRSGHTQILVSATERRAPDRTESNGFWLVDWNGDRSVQRLEIHGRDACSLAPHGVATAEVEPGRWQLWAVTHYDAPTEGPCAGLDHAVEHFELREDGLHFLARLSDPLLTNPNDLDALPDGRLWISNNPPWPEGKGLAGDLIFRRAKGQVLHYAPGEGFSVAADRFVFPNGIHAEPDASQLWVAASAGDLFRLGLDGEGHEREDQRERVRVEPKATLDNLLLDPADGSLWVAGHPKGFAFIRHAKDPAEHSPTTAYRIERGSMTTKAIGWWGEGRVDAGASVVPLTDQLVFATVFGPGLRSCDTLE